MVQYNPLQYLPLAEELPNSDDTSVDMVFSASEQCDERARAILPSIQPRLLEVKQARAVRGLMRYLSHKIK